MTEGLQTWHLGVNALFLIPGKVGGSETYFIETLKALLPLHRGTCTLFTNRENDGFLREYVADTQDRVRFENLGFRAENRVQRILREQVQLPSRVKRAGCDVLWSPGYTACLLAPCPQVVTIFDMQYRRFPRDLSPTAWLTTHVLVTLGARRCWRVLTTSAFSRAEIATLTGIPPERIAVTQAAAGNRFDPSGPSASRPAGVPYLLCVSNSYPHKRLDGLVRAFDGIADSIPHRLVLVGGPGRGEAELVAAIRRARHADRVDRRSGVPPDQLAALYQAAALFVFPSQYEGFGLPVLEAMRAGVPVLTTRCGSLSEVGGEAVAYFDADTPEAMGAAIVKCLARSPEANAAAIAAGRARASEFAWERTARVTYETLCPA